MLSCKVLARFGAASGGTVSDYVLSPAMTGPTASLTKQTGLLGTGTLLNGLLLSAAPDGTVRATHASTFVAAAVNTRQTELITTKQWGK